MMSDNTPDAPLTRGLAGFISATAPTSLPTAVRDRTSALVLDGMGALVAAANPEYSTGRIILDHVAAGGGTPEATLIGRSVRVPAAQAALANGTLGYACDFEPHHPEGILHPIAVILPTALAMGELTEADGARLLTAIAVGCEVEYRVSMALGPAEQYALGFHPSAVCGCFGAAAAAANMLVLDPESTEIALGLAACQASGLMAWETDPTENSRPFQMGMAARNGVTAALLADQGFGGPHGVFDHGHTVFNAFSRSPRPRLLLQEIGVAWDGIAELAIKPYPCVSFLHPALDALLEAVRAHDLSPDDIAALDLRFPKSGVHCVDGNPLKSHCAQYVLAVAIADRGLTVGDLFADRRKTDGTVRDLSSRITVTADTDELEALFPDAYASEITLRTGDGRTITARNDIARGYPEEPLPDSELAAKFARLTESVMPPAEAEALRTAILGLPGASDLGPLIAALGAVAADG